MAHLDVLVAEMAGSAGAGGLVFVIDRVEVGPAGDEQLSGAPLAPGRREMQQRGALGAAIAAAPADGGAVSEQPSDGLEPGISAGVVKNQLDCTDRTNK